MDTLEIIKQARDKGLCKEWFSSFMRNSSLKNLCEKYFEGSDWAMENDFPNLSILNRFKGDSEQYGLFTDFVGLAPHRQQMAFFGKSKAEIIADGYDVKEIYIRHNSELKLVASGNAYVVVNALDNAKIEVKETENAKVVIYNYSEKSTISGTGNFKVLKTDFN